MSSQRKAIRQGIADLLMRSTPAGVNVFSSRSKPLWNDFELPAICVYCKREQIEISTEGMPRTYLRSLEVRIEIAANGEDADDTLDDIGDRVERIIGRSDRVTIAGEALVSDIILTSEELDYQADGEKVTGSLVITYTATYESKEPDDDDVDPVDDFDTVGTEVNQKGEQASEDAAHNIFDVST